MGHKRIKESVKEIRKWGAERQRKKMKEESKIKGETPYVTGEEAHQTEVKGDFKDIMTLRKKEESVRKLMKMKGIDSPYVEVSAIRRLRDNPKLQAWQVMREMQIEWDATLTERQKEEAVKIATNPKNAFIDMNKLIEGVKKKK